MKHFLCLIALLLIACGKEAPQPEPQAKAVPKPIPAKKLPPTPQGKLPKMDPEKAKFIAVPSTAKDPEVKKPVLETKKAEPPATEIKKAAPPAVETKKAEPAAAAQK
jgi:hypothetical protein